jgi:hypothetical protein
MKSRVLHIETQFKPSADAVLHTGDCIDFLRSLPDGTARPG